MREQEVIEVPKRAVNVMIKHFGILIRDFEKLAEQEMMREVEKRIEDIKKGRVKGLSEDYYREYMKKKGVHVG